MLISAKNLLTQLSRAVFSGSFLLVSPFVSCQKEVFPIVFQHMLAGHGGFLVSCHFFYPESEFLAPRYVPMRRHTSGDSNLISVTPRKKDILYEIMRHNEVKDRQLF